MMKQTVNAVRYGFLQWSDQLLNRGLQGVILILILFVMIGCSGNLRWRRNAANTAASVDSIPQVIGRIRADTVNRQIMNLLDEEYALVANLVIGNIVKSQLSLYEGRYREAEQLLLQAQNWLSSPDVLIALGNVFEVQGLTKKADSCWLEAWKLDSLVDRRAIRLPRKPWLMPSHIDTASHSNSMK